MAETPRVYRGEALADNATVAATEEVLATVSGVTPKRRDSRVRLIGSVFATGAAGTTTATLRIRRGTTVAGTLIGEAGIDDLTGAISGAATIQAEDQPGEGSFSYVLTGSIGGAAATVQNAVITALAE